MMTDAWKAGILECVNENITRQRRGKHVSAVTDVRTTVELSEAVFPAFSLFTMLLLTNGLIYIPLFGFSAVMSHFFFKFYDFFIMASRCASLSDDDAPAKVFFDTNVSGTRGESSGHSTCAAPFIPF
jgi:hypothetical protein